MVAEIYGNVYLVIGIKNLFEHQVKQILVMPYIFKRSIPIIPIKTII